MNGVAEVRALQGQLPTPITDNEYRRNLAINPSVTVDTTGYSAIPGVGGAATLSRVATGGMQNGAFARATWTQAPTAAGAVTGIRYAQVLSGKSTGEYSFHFRIRSNRTRNLRTFVRFLDGSTIVSTLDYTTLAINANEWQHRPYYMVKVAGPFTNIDITVTENDSVAQVGDTIDMTWMMIEHSILDGYFDPKYFDGSISDYPAGRVPGSLVWTGTPGASQSIIQNTGTLILIDYEAAAGINSYSVVETLDTGAAATVELELDAPWLLVPVLPNYSEKVRTITNYGSQRQAQSTVHSVIGRADPLVAFGVLGDRTGTLEIFADSLAQARALETVFNRGEVVMLKQNVDAMDMYFAATSTTINPYSVEGEKETKYSLSVSYTELKRPIGNLAGALGWTFNELALFYASFDEVTMKFATFNDLTIRKEK